MRFCGSGVRPSRKISSVHTGKKDGDALIRWEGNARAAKSHPFILEKRTCLWSKSSFVISYSQLAARMRCVVVGPQCLLTLIVDYLNDSQSASLLAIILPIAAMTRQTTV